LAAVLRINKSNAAGNSKRLYTPGRDDASGAEIFYHLESTSETIL